MSLFSENQFKLNFVLFNKKRSRRNLIGDIIIASAISLIILLNLILPYIYQSNSTTVRFFRYSWDLEFFVGNLKLVPYTYSKNCPLCKNSPHNKKPNSTPKDVILSYASGYISNMALFVRTLRTTHSNCSIVLFFDIEVINSLTDDEKQFLIDCDVQIIVCNFANAPEVYLKSYAFELFESFIRNNVMMINRVIICDLFDFLFQGDPFNEYLPKDEIHIVHELEKLGDYGYAPTTNRDWILKFDPYYEFSFRDKLFYYFCSGYMEGPPLLMIDFLNLFLESVPIDKDAVDQGGFNYIYITGRVKKAHIPIAKYKQYDLVAHTASNPIRNEVFPNVTTLQNKSVIATCVHHYYSADDDFIMSLLKACPRPTKEFHNYLSKHRNNELEIFEMRLENPDSFSSTLHFSFSF